MKVIDEKGRLFGKINLFDLIVVLALLVVVAGVGYKVVQTRQQAGMQEETKTYVATVKCFGMPDTFSEALLKDSRIYYDGNYKFVNAKIINVREEPAVVTIQTADGSLVSTVDPNLKDVYVELEIENKASEDSVKIGPYAVCVGGNVPVKTIYAFAAGTSTVILDLYAK